MSGHPSQDFVVNEAERIHPADGGFPHEAMPYVRSFGLILPCATDP